MNITTSTMHIDVLVELTTTLAKVDALSRSLSTTVFVAVHLNRAAHDLRGAINQQSNVIRKGVA